MVFNWDNATSGLVGAIIGSVISGFITWLVAHQGKKHEVKRAIRLRNEEETVFLQLLKDVLDQELRAAQDFIPRLINHNEAEIFDVIFPITADDMQIAWIENSYGIISRLPPFLRKKILGTYARYKSQIKAAVMHNKYIETTIHYAILHASNPSNSSEWVYNDRADVCRGYFPTLKINALLANELMNDLQKELEKVLEERESAKQ